MKIEKPMKLATVISSSEIVNVLIEFDDGDCVVDYGKYLAYEKAENLCFWQRVKSITINDGKEEIEEI